MAEQTMDAMRCDPGDLRRCMSVHTQKITDACRDKDCIEDLRVYLTAGSQQLLDSAANAKVRSAELLYSYIDVEKVAFDRNHYCVDVTFYYRILADAVLGVSRPATLYGLAVFSKRAVLCGEDSRTHIYRSDTRLNEADGYTKLQGNLPTAVVEVLDPMVLSSRVREAGECAAGDNLGRLPAPVRGQFEEELVLSGDRRRLFVTLGQFSMIRLERDAQLVMPVMDCAVPCKACCETPGSGEDPCEMFSRIPFPTEAFCADGCGETTEGYQTC